jgi:hypothetical protein
MAIGKSSVANYVNTSTGRAEKVNSPDDSVGASGVATIFNTVAYKLSAESGSFLFTETSVHLITEQ